VKEQTWRWVGVVRVVAWMVRKLAVSLFLLSSLVCLGVLVYGDEWVIETVDSAGTIAKYSSIVVDHDGYPHIAYYEETTGEVKYAYRRGSRWHTETIHGAKCAGGEISIALDGRGTPHIAYYGHYGNFIMEMHVVYVWKDDSGWHAEGVAKGWYFGRYISIALDSGGCPHIAYCDEATADLLHAWKENQDWHTEVVARDAAFEEFCMALDGKGFPHIAYYYTAWGATDLTYAYKDDTGWRDELVDSSYEGSRGKYTQHVSIAVDKAGHPHICYFNEYVGKLRYVFKTDSGWDFRSTNTTGEIGGENCIVLDRAGYPHITYNDDALGDLKYVFMEEGIWRLETVDSSENVGKYQAICLDESGHPHISYYDATNTGLKYAHSVGDESFDRMSPDNKSSVHAGAGSVPAPVAIMEENIRLPEVSNVEQVAVEAAALDEGTTIGEYINPLNPDDCLEISADGTCYMEVLGLNVGTTGRWKVENGRISLLFPDGSTFRGTVKTDAILLEGFGMLPVVWVKPTKSPPRVLDIARKYVKESHPDEYLILNADGAYTKTERGIGEPREYPQRS